ncbi:alkene reductase [Sphingobium algorifonticola]|uniref:Alkene reductase n=1 Tax=Sphingobium algorifonticola TaxID=2008318 RepID=A0A437J404_9SPHN|nr:alkene reductase [Sphingobium algorifonticola]RVT39285.1 alkene reductase [Sphingobium algorifonticola]
MSRSSLFTPVELGALRLSNRIVMAPLTRARADVNHVPTAMMAEYYAQRADCGLIISEATAVDPQGMGWYRAPGIWNEDMVTGWRVVTDAVHQSGGQILAQLWHMGRLVLPDYLDGRLPMGPSPIAGEGETFAPRPAGDDSLFLPMKPYVVPREMTQDDIDKVVSAYGRAAANALSAGFDGVEIHGANGYIIDQFLQSKTNHRTDNYGGPLGNRLRLLSEIVAAVTEVIEPGRVGLRISPTSERKGMGDEDPGTLAQAIGELCSTFGLAYVHLIEPIASGFMEKPANPVMERLRASYDGAVIQNGSFDGDTAAAFIDGKQADAISFGRPYIANPDLVRRFADELPLATPNFDYAYVGDETGYTDYPTWR